MVFGTEIQPNHVVNALVQRPRVFGSDILTRVTVTIEGDIDEVIATLRGMAGRVASGDTEAVISGQDDIAAEVPNSEESEQPVESPAEPETPEPGLVWNASYVHTFWRNLSDTAREAMIRVSRSPNQTQRRAQLMHTLQLSQRELSGSLSSQGHSLNRLKRRRGDVDLPRPLTYDRSNDVYVLDANFAEAMRELGLRFWATV